MKASEKYAACLQFTHGKNLYMPIIWSFLLSSKTLAHLWADTIIRKKQMKWLLMELHSIPLQIDIYHIAHCRDAQLSNVHSNPFHTWRSLWSYDGYIQASVPFHLCWQTCAQTDLYWFRYDNYWFRGQSEAHQLILSCLYSPKPFQPQATRIYMENAINRRNFLSQRRSEFS